MILSWEKEETCLTRVCDPLSCVLRCSSTCTTWYIRSKATLQGKATRHASLEVS